MNLDVIFAPEPSSVIVAVLFHFLWQAVVVGILVGVIHCVLGTRRPSLRYWSGVVALCMLAAMPVGTAVFYQSNPDWLTAFHFDQAAGESVAGVQGVYDSEANNGTISNWTGLGYSVYERCFSLFVSCKHSLMIVWATGTGLLMIRLVVSWAFCFRVRQGARPLNGKYLQLANRLKRKLNVSIRTMVATSDRVTQAVAIGIIRPMVLIPASWITEMPVQAIEAVIAHELAHIRRWDVLVNLLQRVVETAFFFHPVVWWLSRRIRQDREVCCDRLAIAATNKKITYVETLATVAELTATSKFNPQFGTHFIGGKNMNLLRRIRLALEPTPPGNSVSLRIFGIALAVLIALPAISWFSTSSQAVAYQQNESGDDVEKAKSVTFDFVVRENSLQDKPNVFVHRSEGVIDDAIWYLREHQGEERQTHDVWITEQTSDDGNVWYNAMLRPIQEKSDETIDRAELARRLRQLADEISKEGSNKRKAKKTRKKTTEKIVDRPVGVVEFVPSKVRALKKLKDPKYNKVKEGDIVGELRYADETFQWVEQRNLNKTISDLKRQVEELRKEIKQLQKKDKKFDKPRFSYEWRTDEPRVKSNTKPNFEHKFDANVEFEFKAEPSDKPKKVIVPKITSEGNDITIELLLEETGGKKATKEYILRPDIRFRSKADSHKNPELHKEHEGNMKPSNRFKKKKSTILDFRKKKPGKEPKNPLAASDEQKRDSDIEAFSFFHAIR